MSTVTFQNVLDCLSKDTLLTAVMSSPWNKSLETPSKINIRPIEIKKQVFYQATLHFHPQVTHQNWTHNEFLKFIENALKNNYKQATLSFADFSFHILVNKDKKMTILHKATQTKALPMSHNRTKVYHIPEGTPVPFLIALGIMTSTGSVIAKKYDKFRQINRYLEMVSDILSHLPSNRTIEIIDFGCGKAYLTFALYHYLHHIEKRAVNIIGLDLKKDVIEECQELAKQLNYSSLKFAVGDINQHNPKGKVDLVITLHACDTATDAAIEKAVRWEAEVILCVPCCQHELFSQVKNQALETLLQYGILRERFAALVTDAARAEILTILGYDVQILEFIDMEHTPKNLLIRATKSVFASKQNLAKARYREFKEALSITQSLETRFL